MKKKALILFLVTLTATALLFTGCKNKETETTPVTEETVEEIEPTEPVEEATDQQDGLNEGQVIDRGDTTEVESGSVSSDDISIAGNDVDDEALKAEEEAEQAEEQTTDNNQGSSSSSSDNTNGGKGYEFQGKYYDTEEELVDAIVEATKAGGNYQTPEEAHAENEALKNGFN